jgi:hypothetical protein
LDGGAKVAAISTDEADVRRLLDLLALLPAMDAETGGVAGVRRLHPNLDPDQVEKEGAEWWDRFAQLHHPDEMDGHYCRVHLLPYALRMLEGKATEQDVWNLAQYSLLFFDVADRAECCEHLDVVVAHIPVPAGGAGRRWAESVAEVAWRLYVPRQARYRVHEGLAAWPQPVAEQVGPGARRRGSRPRRAASGPGSGKPHIIGPARGLRRGPGTGVLIRASPRRGAPATAAAHRAQPGGEVGQVVGVRPAGAGRAAGQEALDQVPRAGGGGRAHVVMGGSPCQGFCVYGDAVMYRAIGGMLMMDVGTLLLNAIHLDQEVIAAIHNAA